MLKQILPLCLLAVSATATRAATPEAGWLETDSAAAISRRIKADFPYSLAEAAGMIRQDYPNTTDDDIRGYIEKKYLETDSIDGELRVFRKGVRNLKLLNPAMNGGVTSRGATASAKRISYVDSVLDYYRGTSPKGLSHKVRYRFTIDVPWHESLGGDTLRVWMPLPHSSYRQTEATVLSAFPEKYIVSDSSRSVHHTIYFEQAVREGENTHFEYEGEFITSGYYVHPDTIAARLQLYDSQSESYRHYTEEELPHIPLMPELARKIVGNESNPLRQSEMVYDYIISHYLWAGAREYSTIPCIPLYVVEQGHGDCGQVSLLYISLMRSLGVPARWESGWMLHPGEKNYHDWAEVYFEGVGWVPVDVSFGRYSNAGDPQVQHFYSTGIDSHRFASNRGVCGKLYPEKRFVRSETVDLQPGEVECSQGNLFYPGWQQSLQLLEITPIENDKPDSSK